MVLMLSLCVSVVQAAPATGQGLAQARQCLACHRVDTRRVGPPFTAIAARFGGQEGAQAYLAQVIQKGSTGQWGAIPMPAQPQVSATDAQRLAHWILSLQPAK